MNDDRTPVKSMANYNGDLVNELMEVVGDGLRSVASYDRGGYTMHQIRNDVDEAYTREELNEAYRRIEIEGMGYSQFEEVMHAGGLDCTIYGFEKALMFHFATDVFTGLFVSVDRQSEMDIDAIISACKSAIRRSIDG